MRADDDRRLATGGSGLSSYLEVFGSVGAAAIGLGFVLWLLRGWLGRKVG